MLPPVRSIQQQYSIRELSSYIENTLHIAAAKDRQAQIKVQPCIVCIKTRRLVTPLTWLTSSTQAEADLLADRFTRAS